MVALRKPEFSNARFSHARAILTDMMERWQRISETSPGRARFCRLPAKIAAAAKVLRLSETEPLILDGVVDLGSAEAVVLSFIDDPDVKRDHVLYNGQIMSAGRAAVRVRTKFLFRRTRENATRAPRAIKVDSRPIHARGRAHRAPQTRPTTTSASSALSDPDPSDPPDPQLKPASAAGGEA